MTKTTITITSRTLWDAWLYMATFLATTVVDRVMDPLVEAGELSIAEATVVAIKMIDRMRLTTPTSEPGFPALREVLKTYSSVSEAELDETIADVATAASTVTRTFAAIMAGEPEALAKWLEGRE